MTDILADPYDYLRHTERSLTLDLPGHWSVNVMLRMHHRRRSRIREDLRLHCLTQRPRYWRPLKRWRLDAEIRTWNLLDPLELRASLKLHVDALRLARIVADDSVRELEIGEITQTIDRKNRGVTITVTEVAP